MSIDSFPIELNERQALRLAYDRDLYWCTQKLQQGVSVLIECEKQMIPYVYMNLREELRNNGIEMQYLDGRSVPGEEQTSQAASILRNMIAQITYYVRNSTDQKILVLPHLDLLVSNSENENLTTEAREIIPLLYENPRVVFLAFQDPYFSFSKVIENLFPAKRKLLGIDRECLNSIVLQREARKFPRDFNFHKLYQYVSGLNPVRIRQILSRLDGVDFPQDEKRIFEQLREMTMDSEMQLPNVDLEKDIGGYENVKKKIRNEILGILSQRNEIEDPQELSAIDSIIPKGMIFWGPPGTGKTFFAKAMATALNATIHIVSGPELKSMWVGKSEENIRKLFFKARQSAPSIIVFDEMDSFAGSRQRQTTTTVSHSMVNQLLTEMDGFRKEELVFVIGTTNFVSSLDAALLRPGRFEMKIEIPHPAEDDRREIIKIYDEKLKLNLTEKQREYLCKKTGEITDPMTGSPFTGDHLYSIARFLKRIQVREQKSEFDQEDLYMALRGGENKLALTDEERKVVAYHEAGHALVALSLKDASTVERISIDSDYTTALGYVQHEERKNKYVLTKKQILSELIVLMGGREAEMLVFKDISSGSQNDIYVANKMVEEMVGNYGMSEAFGVRVCADDISGHTLQKRDQAVMEILDRARQKAKEILSAKVDTLHKLGTILLKEKVLEKERIDELIKEFNQDGSEEKLAND